MVTTTVPIEKQMYSELQRFYELKGTGGKLSIEILVDGRAGVVTLGKARYGMFGFGARIQSPSYLEQEVGKSKQLYDLLNSSGVLAGKSLGYRSILSVNVDNANKLASIQAII